MPGYGGASPIVRVAAPDNTPTSFVDDKDALILDGKGNPMLRPVALDPHMFVRAGLEDKKIEDQIRQIGPDGALAAFTYQASQLRNFLYGPWDSQRLSGRFERKYVSYATVAIGLYAAANGIAEEEILSIQNLAAIGSRYLANPTFDKTYGFLPVLNVENTHVGYELFKSGRITSQASR